MARIASDALIERLADWGVDTVSGCPGTASTGSWKPCGGIRTRSLRARPPRGSRRLHGHGARQGDREGRGVPGHVGAGRHSPAQRPVRRQARPHAGAGYHRHAGNVDPRHRIPAGSRARQAVRGRDRVRPDDLQPGQLPRSSISPSGPPTPAAASRTSRCRTTSRWRTRMPTRGSTLPGRRAEDFGGVLSPPGRPSEENLQRRPTSSTRARRSPSWPGRGAARAGGLLTLAETLAAPIVKTLPGKATVPDDSPYTTGGIGLLGTRPSED